MMELSIAAMYQKFNREQAILRIRYQQAGMNEAQISAMYEFDLHQLSRNIAYYRRTQSIEEIDRESNSDSNRKEFRKFFLKLAVPFESSHHSRYWWVEEISEEALSAKINALNDEEIDMLTLLAFDGCTQQQAAYILDIPYRTFKRQFAKIKKFLK